MKKKWTAERRAKFMKTVRQKRRFAKGGAELSTKADKRLKHVDPRTQDAILFLKKMEVEVAKRMSLGRARRVDRVALYGLLALDALTGDLS